MKREKKTRRKLGFIDWAGILKPCEEGPHPFCWIAVVYGSRFLRSTASQPPRKRVEEEGGIMEVRTRIVRDQKVEILRGVVRERDPFIMEMSRQRSKRWGEGEDFFFVVLI